MRRVTVEQHKNMVAEMGCILDHCCAPATLHHPRFCCGTGQRESDWLVIPLCKYHHQDGPLGEAIHNGQNIFERKYGTEAKLLAKVIQRIQEMK